MNIFYRPFYLSDATLFLNQLKEARPELAAEQRAGRGLLWDKEIDRDERAEYKAGHVAQKPYVYQNDGH